jgi:hypothetical protein
MTPDRPLLTRPRTAGEILDDAWRLALADFPLLFALAGLFLVPFCAALLLLLALPRPDAFSLRALCALLVVLLAALTGVGSGACQELFRRRADGAPATFGHCLMAALRRGFDHTAARTVVLTAVLLGLGCLLVPGPAGWLGFACLLLPGLAVWMACLAVHPLIAAGKGRRGSDLKELGREMRFDPGKTAAVVLTRLPLVALGVLNLHLLGIGLFWAAGNLAGFDVALVSFALSLGNPVYVLALTMLVWLLQTPYFEASNFLLHLDTRTRQEGLDLFYRVRHSFPTKETNSAKVLLVLAAGVLLAAPARASEALVGGARVEVGRIAVEVKSAEPYPGGAPWAGRLEKVADRLEEKGGKARFAWFRRRLDGFAGRDRAAALDVLTDLDRRLAREEGSGLSKEQMKGLLRPPRDDDEETESEVRRDEERRREREDPPEVKRDVDARPARRPGSSGPAVSAGGGNTVLIVGVGLLLGVVAAAVVMWLRNRTPATTKAKGPESGAARPRDDLRPDEAEAPALWRRAEELAAKGEYLEALRALYGAVLSLLHRRHFLRYEPTRTNGEYVEQVRLAPEAPPGLRRPFEGLTTLFEWKWYGERTCDGNDFAAGRGLAEEVRGLV